MFNKSATDEIEAIKSRYPNPRSAILPVLFIAQREFGWLSHDALNAVSSELDVPPAFVKGVATFYAMFNNEPTGRHLIQLCTNIACMLFGSESLLEIISKEYAVKPGGTSPDGRFSLALIECLGACDTPPAMIVNNDLHKDLTAENVLEILEGYE
jgi:NADH-quinone oxidoreductase E subunit